MKYPTTTCYELMAQAKECAMKFGSGREITVLVLSGDVESLEDIWPAAYNVRKIFGGSRAKERVKKVATYISKLSDPNASKLFSDVVYNRKEDSFVARFYNGDEFILPRQKVEPLAKKGPHKFGARARPHNWALERIATPPSTGPKIYPLQQRRRIGPPPGHRVGILIA